jgi:hypothetical protein
MVSKIIVRRKIMRGVMFLMLAVCSFTACASTDTPPRKGTLDVKGNFRYAPIEVAQSNDDDKRRCNRPEKDRPGRPCPWDHP